MIKDHVDLKKKIKTIAPIALFIAVIAVVVVLTRLGSSETDNLIPEEITPDVQATPEAMLGTQDNGLDSTSDANETEAQDASNQNDPGAPEPFKIISATELVADIRIGWSLGNTLDAHGNPEGFAHLGDGLYANTTVTEMETGWGRPVTTIEHFNAIKEAGFNAIRIPVTWYKACDADLNIREDWMERVKEVVDYAVANDVYILLNSHHDNILFGILDSEIEESIIAMEKLWEQIAVTFRDYNEKLVFQGLGEPRTAGSPAEWRGGTPEEQNNLNRLNQVFVDTVRNTGGNNAERVLLIPTYAASANEVAQRALVMPEDTVEDRLVVSLHFYEPWAFALRTGEGTVDTWSIDNTDDTRPIMRLVDLAYDVFVSKGIPVIISEMGAINRDNLEARVAWAEFYTSYAKSKGMPCIWWDNGSYWVLRQREWGWEQTFGLLDRENIVIAHPEIVEALLRATQ